MSDPYFLFTQAIQNNTPSVILELLDRHPYDESFLIESFRRACLERKMESASTLLTYGVPVTPQTIQIALNVATAYGHRPLVIQALEKGGNPKLHDSYTLFLARFFNQDHLTPLLNEYITRTVQRHEFELMCAPLTQNS